MGVGVDIEAREAVDVVAGVLLALAVVQALGALILVELVVPGMVDDWWWFLASRTHTGL